MNNRELDNAIRWLVKNRNFVLPYNKYPGSLNEQIYGSQEPAASNLTWEQYQWNPPQFSRYEERDTTPGASRKPTWNDLQEGLRNYNFETQLDENIRQANLILNDYGYPGAENEFVKDVREELADINSISFDGENVAVHGGLDRMSGLLQMVENANESGHPLPYVRMRTDSNKPIDIFTQQRIRGFLSTLADRKNQIESAHNSVMEEYGAITKVRDNPSESNSRRIEYSKRALTYIKQYRSHLETAMAAFDPDSLPTDVDELINVYVERIEAAALARQKHAKQVVTEQGNKLLPSCNDEADTLTRISRAEREAAIDIFSADTAAEAKAAYDAGVTAINAIFPTNSPEFLLNGTPLGRHPADQQLSVTSLTLWADHPSGLGLTRPVGLGFNITQDGAKIRDRSGITIQRSGPGADETRRGITVTFDPSIRAGQTIDLEFFGRSICGISELKVRVIVASS